MNNIVNELTNHLNLNNYLFNNINNSTYSGSKLYGLNNKSSDIDVYSVSMPPIEILFPHLTGFINGFNTPKETPFIYVNNHIPYNGYEYDLTICSFPKFLNLLNKNSPNFIELLFSKNETIIFKDEIGELLLKNKENFINNNCHNSFYGYALSSIKRLDKPPVGDKAKELVEKFGYDTKSAYHGLRLFLEYQQILNNKTIEFNKNSDLLSAVRSGCINYNDFLKIYNDVKNDIDKKDKIDFADNYKLINNLLNESLEIFFGNVNEALKNYHK